MKRAAILLTALIFASGCGSDDDVATAGDPFELLPLHSEPDLAQGGRIVDSLSREVLLRGVNVNSFVEYWSGREFPTTFPLADSDPDLMASIGWNNVRLLLSWSRVEPAPGDYDENYLDEIEATVKKLAERGIYTIIDLHQDAWSATLPARENEDCPEGTVPALGWDGAPAWATFDQDLPRCTVAGIRETSGAVRQAWISFWQNATGPGGIGIRSRFAAMLGHIAERFASEPAIAGYDIINEPNAFDSADLQGMVELYAESIAEIRAAEERANGFSHLILFEPSAIWSAVGQGPPPSFIHGPNVVYAPHIYTGGINTGPITAQAFQIARDEAALFGGAPILSGEWGADPRRASDPEDPYFLDHQRLQDEFRVSATLWTWRESCGDPHKIADFRAGRVARVWGEFEVDCTTNDIVGQRSDLIGQLRRPLVRAAPGQIQQLVHNPATGVFEVQATEAEIGATAVIFYPIIDYGRPIASSVGLAPIQWREGPAGATYAVAKTSAATWSIRLSPQD